MADVRFGFLSHADLARRHCVVPCKISFEGEPMASPLQNLSNDLAAAGEAVASSVVAVHAQHRIPSSGIQWRKDVIVTVNHGIRRSEGISVLLGPEKSVAATIAGRDPSTDLAILKLADE